MVAARHASSWQRRGPRTAGLPATWVLALALLAPVLVRDANGATPDTAPAHTLPPSAASIPHLAAARWREDLRVFAHELTRRHRNAFHHVPQPRFEAAVAELDRRIPTLQDHEVVVGLQSLAAMIGDGHTFLEVEARYRRYPMTLARYGDDLRVVEAAPELAGIAGTRLIAIEGRPIAEVRNRIQVLVPQAENAWHVLHQEPRQLVLAEPLAALGIARGVEAAHFTFQTDAGQRIERTIASRPPGAAWRPQAMPSGRMPSAQRPDLAFFSTAVPGTSTVYADFRRYDDIEQHARALLQLLDASGARRLVLDLRHNRGGNYTLARQHLLYPLQMLPRINRPGGLYVLTGRATFSAAMTNTTDFRRETEAILVGEPPGARPNGYQELSGFTLPNSKLQTHCAILHYRFQPGDSDLVLPDKRIDPDWNARKAGRDETLEWVLAQPLDLPPS